MAKMNIKQAAFEHVEKVVLGIVGLIVLACLFTTNWFPYSGTPAEITQKVTQEKRNLQDHRWPESEQSAYQLSAEDTPANVVHVRLQQNLDPTPLEMSGRLVVDVFGSNEPVREPKTLAPMELIADSGRAYLHLRPTFDTLDTEEEMNSDFGESQSEDDSIPDEFRGRAQQSGSAMGLLGGMDMETDYGSLAGELGRSSSYDQMEMYQQYLGGGGAGGLLGGPGGPGGMLGGPGGGMAGLGIEGKGYHFVSVRAVFPLREQIREFSEAIHRSYHETAQVFDIRDFELERQRQLPGDDQWTEWEKVDLEVAWDVLDKSDGWDADVVNSIITNAVVTMPLPMRISGRWVNTATHPRIKKFELTDEQMALEVSMQRRLLEQAATQQKQLDETTVKRGGFAPLQFDQRQVTSDVLGIGSAFNIGTGGDLSSLTSMSMMGGMGGRMPSGMNSMSGGLLGGMPGSPSMNRPGSSGMGGRGGLNSRNQRGAQQQMVNPIESIIKEMTKETTDPNQKKEIESQIRSWVSSRISADGELLLFRYLDFDVTPGQTYRYRVRFILANPNYGRRIADAGGLQHVVEGETRATPWSNLTPSTPVQKDLQYFLTDARTQSTRPYPSARFDVFQWDSDHGTTMNAALEIRLGQRINDQAKTMVIDPAEPLYEEQDYRFTSRDFLVDVIEDLQLDPELHEKGNDPNKVKLAAGWRGRLQLSPKALVKTAESGIHLLNSASQKKDLEQMKYYQELQSKQFAYLQARDASALEGLGMDGMMLDGELGGLAGQAGVSADMISELLGGGKRTRNILRKARPTRSGPNATRPIGPGAGNLRPNVP